MEYEPDTNSLTKKVWNSINGCPYSSAEPDNITVYNINKDDMNGECMMVPVHDNQGYPSNAQVSILETLPNEMVMEQQNRVE